MLTSLSPFTSPVLDELPDKTMSMSFVTSLIFTSPSPFTSPGRAESFRDSLTVTSPPPAWTKLLISS